MAGLSNRVARGELEHVRVVADQVGQLTFTDELARAMFWLLGYRKGDVEPSRPAAYGIYNVTGSGRPASWIDIASHVFKLLNGNASAIVPVSVEAYAASVMGAYAALPAHSELNLTKLALTGFVSRDWEDDLGGYVGRLYEKAER